MSKNLLIVESPTKAKTIGKFLGSNYKVVSSFGHIRDLPLKEMGIDIEHEFEPKYVIPAKAKSTVEMLKKEAEKVENIYFATDEDREGEAIAWHLQYVLANKKNKHKYYRIVFHEITAEALKKSLDHVRDIDLNLVDAQQARRILDRLVGYELSPFLWKKVAKGLSAGRVQSVAVRLVVEREREVQAFKPEEYWSLEALLKTKNKEVLSSELFKINDKKIDKFTLKNKKEVDEIIKSLKLAKYSVKNIEKKSTKRQPLAPYTTSTLQQEANNKLHFSSKQTMFVAQSLYEGVDLKSAGMTGLITYMRTDSLNLAKEFLMAVNSYIKQEFGDKYALNEARYFKNKSKNAQEAHEAIRPTDIIRKPDDLKPYLSDNQYKLYSLIWKRTLATQMKEAEIDATIVEILAKNRKEEYGFKATGSAIKFDGFLKVYSYEKEKENLLPNLVKNQELQLEKLDSKQHFTEPPARYTEASIIKKLEELGIGRPSTYAPTISTIEDRGYIEKNDRKLFPKDIAYIVNDLLVKHFPQIVDFQFTAEMEESLDKVADGDKKWVPVVKAFYKPFKENLDKKYDQVKKDDLVNEKTEEICEKCGSSMIIKTGRYGKFLACSNYPKCKNIKNIKKERTASGKMINVSEDKKEPVKTEQKCEKCGAFMLIRDGRFGQFLACENYPKCKNTKPLDYSTGVKCPECKEGEIVSRRTRTRRIFYACNRYPNCKFAIWGKPTGKFCPKCKSLLTEDIKGNIKCSNKECTQEN